MTVAAMMWRYSVRWGLPHRSCAGEMELVAMEVPAGEQCPESVKAFWTPGSGYAICLDFPPPATIKRWSAERKGAARRRNLERRLQNAAPLFFEELLARELASKPDYYQGL